MTNFNERRNTLLYKNIPLTLYSRKGWYWLCVRGELETGTDCYMLTQSSSEHSSTSFSSWLGCSKPSVCHWLSFRYLVTNWLQLQLELTDSSRQRHLVIFLFDVHLLPVGVRICHHHRIQLRSQVKVIFRYLRPDAHVSLFFRLFTQVHVLIDGSVEGQYITFEGDLKSPFSIATTSRCRRGRYSFPWIVPFYPWSGPYNAEC